MYIPLVNIDLVNTNIGETQTESEKGGALQYNLLI